MASTISKSISDLVIEARESSSCVRIYRQSKKGTLPLSLACRATRAFAPKTLLLVPGNSSIFFPGVQPSTARPQKKNTNLQKCLVTKVDGSVCQTLRDGRCRRYISSDPDSPYPRKLKYELITPLVRQARAGNQDEISTKHVHPFWVVIQQKSVKSVHNMELGECTFDVPHPLIKGLSKSEVATTVTLPVLYNIAAVEAEDLLTLPYEPDEGDED